MNTWLLYTLAYALVANVLAKYLIKKATSAHSRTKRIALQYFFCFFFASCVSFLFGTRASIPTTLIIGGIGLANGIAASCQWRAMDISVSKTALFTFWDDIIAMTLSYVVLNEGRWLNTLNVTGTLLSIASVVALARIDYQEKGAHASPLVFYGYVAVCNMIWGGALFSMKYFGVSGVDFASFALPWYGGAFVSTACVAMIYSEAAPSRSKSRLTQRDICNTAVLGGVIVASLGLGYLSYQHAPQIVVQPIMLVSEMVLTAFVGLLCFRETRQFNTPRKKLIFVSALLGGFLVAVSY